MTTFKVESVAKNTVPLPHFNIHNTLLKDTIRLDDIFKIPSPFISVDTSYKNSFVEAVHAAYVDHYPLILSPDIIWQCVVQGLALHVKKNAEKLGHLLVSRDEKKEVRITANILPSEYDFRYGPPPRHDDDWEVGVFSEEIKKNVVDDIHGLLSPEFSTTEPVGKASVQAVMMMDDAVKEHVQFDFTAREDCGGIPEITLEGTVEDWKALREKTLQLSQFDLEWWTDTLRPVLEEFVSAASGNTDKEFWKSIYKVDVQASGGSFISGWILTLFPYVGICNQHLHDCKAVEKCAIGKHTTQSFPRGIVSVPFTWVVCGGESSLHFLTGFLGIGQHKESLGLRPLIGWAVYEKLNLRH